MESKGFLYQYSSLSFSQYIVFTTIRKNLNVKKQEFLVSLHSSFSWEFSIIYILYDWRSIFFKFKQIPESYSCIYYIPFLWKQKCQQIKGQCQQTGFHFQNRYLSVFLRHFFSLRVLLRSTMLGRYLPHYPPRPEQNLNSSVQNAFQKFPCVQVPTCSKFSDSVAMHNPTNVNFLF